MESSCVCVCFRGSVSQSVEKSRNSALETLQRAVNAVRDFFFQFEWIWVEKRPKQRWKIFLLTKLVWHFVIFGQKMRILDFKEFWRFRGFDDYLYNDIELVNMKIYKVLWMFWCFKSKHLEHLWLKLINLEITYKTHKTYIKPWNLQNSLKSKIPFLAKND